MDLVRLVTDAEGGILRVTDARGLTVAHEVCTEGSERSALDAAVSVSAVKVDQRLCAALNGTVQFGGAHHTIALPTCSVVSRSVKGAVFYMKGADAPRGAWPIALDYATGVTVVELKRSLRNGAYLSPDLFRSDEFAQRAEAARAQLRIPSGTPPGVISAGQRALQVFETLTSESTPSDPLLRKFRPRYLDNWQPHMTDGDFVAVFMSTWDFVDKRTAAAFGHTQGDIHYYLVAKRSLEPWLADQIRQLVRTNPDGQTWEELANRREFERAHKIAEDAREALLERFMHLSALEPRHTENRYVHTTSNVLVPGATAPDGTPCVAYYSGCAPASRKPGGILSLSENAHNAPIMWWPGPYSPDNPGGEKFHVRDLGDAVPTLGDNVVWNRALVDTMVGAGHSIAEHGYFKLQPLA